MLALPLKRTSSRVRLIGRLLAQHQCKTAASWTSRAAQADNLVQSYVSTSDDPVLNLSIEHYLLEKTPAKSIVLFLYINRPCIVIGRNQNPWLEVNLDALAASSTSPRPVELVRRRSGGGAVFHDEGNVNWTVISPSESFTRDKHVEMVVRALRANGIERARVNERHDIVLDQGVDRLECDSTDLHKTPYIDTTKSTQALKVSGSAYKLIKGRALHHGTCLLTSPNLKSISKLLRSPARAFIKAKGVESVSSPVTNIGLSTSVFTEQVRQEFAKMYGDAHAIDDLVGEEALEDPQVAIGSDEMHTPEWMWDQTPQFSFSAPTSTEPQSTDVKVEYPPPSGLSIDMSFRHGRCQSASLTFDDDGAYNNSNFSQVMQGRLLRDAWTWQQVIEQSKLEVPTAMTAQVVDWLERMLPVPP